MNTETQILKQEDLPEEDVGGRNEVSPSEDTLNKLGLYLQNRFKRLKDLTERASWEQDKANAFKSYHLIPRDRTLPYMGAANLPCPLPRIGVDSFHANVMASLFSNGNQMRVRPLVIQKELAHKADKAAQYMTYVMNFEANSYEAFDDGDKKAEMFGIGYLEPKYIKKERWETVEIKTKKTEVSPDPVTGEMKIREKKSTKKEKKKKTIFDGIQIESIPVESMYFSPFFRTLEEAWENDVVFKVFTMPFEKLKRRTQSEDGTNYIKSQVGKIARTIVEKYKKIPSELEQARMDLDGFYIDVAPEDESVEMAESYLWYDIDGDNIKEGIKATLNPVSGAVVKVTLSKLRIIELVPRPIDERLPGEGIPKIAVPLCDEWENFHNTRSNAGQWENSFIGFYRAGGRFNPQQITIQPNHFYPVDDPREISFPQTQRVSSSYFQEEQMIVNYFERIFAINENMQGVQSRKNQTATENMNQSSKASVRFSNPFNRIVTQTNKLLNHIWELSCECAPDDKEFYIVGKDGSPIFDKMTKDDYSSRFQFQLVVQSVFDTQQIRDTVLLAYRLFLQNPFVQQHPEVMWDLSQKTLDSLNLDVDIPKPPQAKTLSPFEEHQMFQNGEDPEPQVGEDYEHHMKIHMAQINSEEFLEWDVEAQKKLFIHTDKTKILKQTLESSNLNKSGMAPQGMPQQPGMTVSKNPSQMMNKTRVGESPASQANNARGPSSQGPSSQGQGGNLDQVTGPI